ncbi:MAG: DJ-1/PfpI family protein [Gemmatimonadaceae bacterium]|nr:DJ-1/PfpI family protein [Gemmatimonadaceae bacterium]
MATPRTVGIFMFDEVEVLDFAGPFEVFSVFGRRSQLDLFRVLTVSERGQPITARNGLVITPTHGFATCPPLDILLVPGGFGTRREMTNPVVLEWVSARARASEYTLSVCTGALILGTAGLLDGRNATTHHLAVAELAAAAPAAIIHPEARMVDNGSLLCSSGVSAGIDMSLYLAARLHGDDLARETARYMEYEGRWSDPSRVVR